MCPSALSVDAITPGETTYEDVIGQYGQPDDEYTEAGIRYLLYETSPTAYDSVGIQDGKVVLLALYPPQTENAGPEDYVPGDPELSYFSQYGHGARTLAYPSKGITLVVTAKNVVAQAIYTAPLSKDDFQARFGGVFPAEDPFGHDL